MGYAVSQLVEALRYKPQGRGFDWGNCNGNLAQNLGLGGSTGKPTECRKDPQKVGLLTTLCTRHGLYCTTRAGRNAHALHAKIVRHPAADAGSGEGSRGNERPEATKRWLESGMAKLTWAWVTEEIKTAWYTANHEIIPTNERPAAIHLVDTDGCRRCGRQDTLIHRLSECIETAAIWEWTRRRAAMMLRTDPRYITADWILRPQFHFWPTRRQRAHLWTFAHLIWYRIQGLRRQSLVDYIEFLRRSRWKT
jgi:hypothetical protein